MPDSLPAPENVTAIAFAYFGVLAPPARSLGDVASTAAADPAFGAGAPAHAEANRELARLLPVIGYAIDQRADETRDGDCRFAPAASVVYDTLLAASGEPPAGEVVAGVVHAFDAYEAQPIIPEAAAVVRELYHLGLPIGLVANCVMPGEGLRAQWVDAGLEDMFDAVVLASEWGWCMPHPSVFRELLEGLECKPEEVLLVCGDFATSVKGGETAGMRTVWLQGELEERVQQVDHSYVIRDLSVLLDWFGDSA